jgi:hypothetical protein
MDDMLDYVYSRDDRIEKIEEKDESEIGRCKDQQEEGESRSVGETFFSAGFFLSA